MLRDKLKENVAVPVISNGPPLRNDSNGNDNVRNKKRDWLNEEK